MSISFALPESLEKELREKLGDLDQAAKEAALVELYRQERLTHHQLGEALRLSRFETDAVLKTHKVTEDCLDVHEHERQIADLERLKRP
jgi:hypothetical protein